MKASFIFLLLCFTISSLITPAAARETIVFKRVSEPRENAFSLLIPSDWQVEGGIVRIDPTRQGGPAQSVAAKLDFSVKKNAAGSVMIRWLPDVLFFDPRMSPAGQMGLLQPGSNYQGMTVSPIMQPQQFIVNVVIPYAHPQISNLRVLEQKDLSPLAAKYQQRVAQAFPMLTFSYQAAMLTVSYRENGVDYREKIVTFIENWGQMGAGMWGNKETFLLRTPVDRFSNWESVFSIIQNSVQINPRWVAGEVEGQIKRGHILINTQREIQSIGREIAEHRQKTNAEIHNDIFLTLTDQEEYVNPYTNQVETGSNQWKFRWINPSGEVIYTDSESYNPNTDIHLNVADYKRTPIRKRFPQ